jgi:hypothetical protein
MASLWQSLVSAAEVDVAMAQSPAVHAGLIARAEEVKKYWVEYWESFDHPYSREHTLKSGYVERPGDYSESVKVEYMKSKTGLPKARVSANDYKAFWIEYGSKHMPKFAPRQATLDHFGGDSTVSA